jgi:hypothetical protein
MANADWLPKWGRSRSSRYADNERPPKRISPPPMKRQRTWTEDSHLSTNGPKMPLRDAQGSRHSLASSDFPKPHADTRQEHRTKSRKSGAACLNGASHSESSKKPVCRVCMKGTNVKYDPIIACPGCRGQFHDSCRKPPLIEAVDP